MNQILPYSLWVGHAGDSGEVRQLFDAGIKAIVQVAEEEPPVVTPRELICCRFPLVDGPGNETDVLVLAMQTLASLLRRHVPTLVCCGGGVSRAPALAAAGLALAYGETPEGCLERVVRHHRSDVTPGFWKEVIGIMAAFR
jgi:protein-tyrosine phosphatase